MRFYILECLKEGCGLRFPATEQDRPVRACPRCGSALRVAAEGATIGETRAARHPLPLELLVDNVRSAFNVGSMLRSCDAAGVRQVTLCGITPTPEHPRVARSALGAEQTVAWSYAPNGLEAATRLRAEGTVLWALEEGAAAHSIFEATLPLGPLALIVGNEGTGVDPGLLAIADALVCLPMRGVKRSLNVAVAFGAAVVLVAERLVIRAAQQEADGERDR